MAPTPGPVLEAGHGSQVQVEEGSFPMTPRGHNMTVTHAKGLLNMPGQNNCFLNSAVQVLWHLDIFRRSFRELSGHACMAESCIFCALKELFTQFQYSQESALPPDALRHALAKTFCDQRRFQLGFMDDAAECFENILLRIHVHIANQEHEDMCGDVQCIPHQKFAMTLVEQPVCHNCGTTSEPLPFTQMVHYVTTSALCSKAFEMQDQEHGSAAQNSFGRLLKIAGNVGEVRECSSGCGSKFQVKKTLMNHPEIVSIGLVWDSECPSLQHITDVFHSIGMCLRLQDMFHSVYDYDWAKETSHELVGVVTYYGKHYSTFFFHTKLKVWIYFDDATVREIGPNWEQVVEKCQKGRFQPLLLLFANPNGSSFSPSTIAHEQSHQNVALKVGPIPNSSNQKQAVMHKYLMLQNSLHNNNLRSSYKPVTERTNPLQSYSKYDPSAYPMLSAVLNSHQNSVKNQMASVNSRVIGQSSNSPVYSNGNGIGIPYPTFYYNTESNNMKVSACDSNSQLKHIYSNVNISKYPPQGPETQLHPQLSDISKANETCLPPITTLKYSSRSTPQFSENSEPPQFKPNEFVDSTKDSDSAFTEEDPECNETYISRKAVENVLNLQKLQRQISLSRSYSHTSVGNRNSSSSLESFENVHCNKNAVPRDHVLESSNFPVRRDSRDSGNWSVSDRNSSSSNTSTENPFLTMVASKRLLLGLNMHSSVGKGQLPDYSNTSTSDHGYDSYSVSSSDSYPSINNSPVKLDPRLTQIPEDWNGQDNLSDLDKKLMMITEESLGPPDCDKLCAEADLLLAKSHDKEKEGDLVMAALLCDSAAARARAAMDAPYNNSRSLVSAKMKHSTCVLRSSCLYRRLKDNEAEEKRKQKGNHSRQSSRDSTHSRHSRQGSKDSTHSKQSQKDNSQQVFEETENFGKNIEIYGTLPKKGSRKKSSSPGSSKAKDDQVYKDFLDKQRKNTNVSTSPNESVQKNNKQPIRLENGKGKCDTSSEKQQKKNIIDSISAKSTLRKVVPTPSKDFSIGTNAKRWTAKQPIIEQSYLGLFPLQDSDFSDDRELTNRDLLSPLSSPDKKQHRIKRRLMGGFMKRKNRSLPDLRADEDLADPVDRSIDDVAIQIPSILTLPNGKLKKLDYQSDANVSNVSRGFHQPHYAFVKKDLTQRPLLMKVNPPNVQYSVVTSPNPKSVHTLPSLPKKPTESKSRVALNFNSDKPSKIPFMTFPKHEMPSSAALQPLKSVESQPQQQVPPQRVSSIPVLTSQVIAPLTKSVTFKEESQVLPIVSNNLLSNNKDDLPPPSNPFLAEIQAKRKQIIDAKSQQNTETKKEIRNLKTLQPIANREMPSLLPKLTTTNDGASWLKELQTKQLQMRHKQGESVIPLPKADKKIQDIPKIIGNISVAETGTLKNSSNPAVVSSGNLTKLTEINGANTSFKLPESTAHEITRNHAKNITSVNTERKSTSSVKDLASRFEKILIKPKDIVSSSYDSSSAINAETNATDGKPDSNNMCNINSSLSQDEIHRNQRFEEGVMPTENALDMQSQPQRTNLSNEFCADTNTHYNDYTNMNCQRTESDIPLGTSNANAPIVQRPQRPPDYETAMLRLEFIRTTPGTTTDSAPSHLNLNTDSRPQRKKGPKKTVTFSDEVVLVACAEFDDSGFLANPLLERVYQQHIEAGGSEISHFSAVGSYRTDPSEAGFSNPAGDYSQVKDNGHIESTMGNPDAQSSNDAVPCHLCHNKHVSPPIIYCTDCEFYMSRFQP